MIAGDPNPGSLLLFKPVPMKKLLIVFLMPILSGCAFVDRYHNEPTVVRVNQVGYLANGPKMAIVVNAVTDSFRVEDRQGRVRFQARLLDKQYWNDSGEESSVADFSEFQESGTFRIISGEYSDYFTVAGTPYVDLIRATAKAYYFNRASSALEEKYAGRYARSFSHPDTLVYVHRSAASAERPAGTIISSPRGWYDAGDYNKYIVNSGIATFTLMLAYEHNTGLFDTLTWNIPESENHSPDLMDEVLWNIRWMETMQDPADGGVYHKETSAEFEQFIFPSDAHKKRFVVTKGTAATLDFAAVMARASRILRKSRPEYADSLLAHAVQAWNWARQHPDIAFRNPGFEDAGNPAINTGEYGDAHLNDEFFWAGAELFLSTGDEGYLSKVNMDEFASFRIPSWGAVETLGLIALASGDEGVPKNLKKHASDELLMMSEKLIAQWQNSPYRITLNTFHWGSNSDILNQGLVLVNAYRIFGNNEFLQAALSSLDYVLGRNATGYCFVTGFGERSPMHIHHRQSASDTVREPVPGFLAGGPNPYNTAQDCGESHYPTTLPAKCYIDQQCSYSTNEIAINWNAPLVYMSSSLQMIYLEKSK